MFRNISDSIQQAWLASLDPLSGSLDALPTAFIADIEAILGNAYEWHRVVKVEVVKYDLEPFTVQPLSPYDPARMEPFEPVLAPVAYGQPIISSVSLGLVATTALEDRRVSRVQNKIKVLVEEWFFNHSSASKLQMKGGWAACYYLYGSKLKLVISHLRQLPSSRPSCAFDPRYALSDVASHRYNT